MAANNEKLLYPTRNIGTDSKNLCERIKNFLILCEFLSAENAFLGNISMAKHAVKVTFFQF